MDTAEQAARELEEMGRQLQNKGKEYRRPASAQKLAQAIRRKCRECSGGDRREVEHCPIQACPLHPYRAG